MRNSSKRRLLAVTAAALLAAVATGATVKGSAYAQSGSRLCGVSWKASDTGEHLVRLYEVPKNNAHLNGVCKQAQNPGGGPGDGSPFQVKGLRWSNESFGPFTCEDFPSRMMDGKSFTFVGNNWPDNNGYGHDTADICNNMNRSDTLLDMEAYFLYNDGSESDYQFQRG